MQDNESAGGGGWEQPDPPDHPDQETIAFGYEGHPDRGTFGEDGYGPTGYGRYGAAGYGGSGTAGYGGSGTAGWGPYAPMPPPPLPPRRSRRMLRYVTAAVLAAGLSAGLTAAFDTQNAGSSPRAPGIAASDVPEPHDIAVGSGSSSSPLNQATVEAKVKPGLVDIDATLRYQDESAEGTGMIL